VDTLRGGTMIAKWIGKIVLALVMIWCIVCTEVYLFNEFGLVSGDMNIDFQKWLSKPVVEGTLWLLILFGAIFIIEKVSEWISLKTRKEDGNNEEEAEEKEMP